jgi:thiol-disulfide isomerase/thioredoxin
MQRRQWIMGGVAAAAGAAGVTVAWRQLQPHGADAGPGGSDALLARQSLEAFWALRFDTPDGQSLALASLRGKPLLINFWATWCPPCVEELPLLDQFYQTNRAKWQVVGLAVDQPSAVQKWLATKPLSFAVGMAGLGGTELSKSLGNVAGSLPFTAVFGGSGALLHRKVGKVSETDLAQWVTIGR